MQQHSIWWKNLHSCLSSSKHGLKVESFHFITFISGWHGIIVIPGFKFVTGHPKIVLSRICAGYLCLMRTKRLEKLSSPLASLLCLYNYSFGLVVLSFEKVICCSVWLLCFPYWHTAITQFDRILIKYLVISVMYRKVFYNKFQKL